MDDGILALGSKEFMEENLSFTNYKLHVEPFRYIKGRTGKRTGA